MPRGTINEPHITATMEPWTKQIDLRYGLSRQGGQWLIARTPEMELVNEGTFVPPLLTITSETAVMLMDELWRCGIRPTQEVGTTGQIQAMQAHIDHLIEINRHLMIPPVTVNMERDNGIAAEMSPVRGVYDR